MLAEDPKVPASYRTLLGSLRDDNDTMSAAALWHTLPPTVRSRMSHLGRCLGAGSVKQVNLCRMHAHDVICRPVPPEMGTQIAAAQAGGQPGSTDTEAETFAVAVLRRRVEDEALASLGALDTSKDLAPVAKRLGRLVYGEFNLFAEGEALTEFASTSIGMRELLSC